MDHRQLSRQTDEVGVGGAAPEGVHVGNYGVTQRKVLLFRNFSEVALHLASQGLHSEK
eukprot:COSAG01_NODE_54541_length_331_cov_1.060345_1_plen_57_part_10